MDIDKALVVLQERKEQVKLKANGKTYTITIRPQTLGELAERYAKLKYQKLGDVKEAVKRDKGIFKKWLKTAPDKVLPIMVKAMEFEPEFEGDFIDWLNKHSGAITLTLFAKFLTVHDANILMESFIQLVGVLIPAARMADGLLGSTSAS